MHPTTALITLLAAATAIGAANTDAADLDFVQDVRPILQTHCYSCHGEAKQKSGLRLDIKSEAFEGGEGWGPSIVPGDSTESPLIELVSSDDEYSRMPPEGEPLSDTEIRTLTDWIDQGATWPDGVDLAQVEDRTDHWSLKPVAIPDVPHVGDDTWARSDLDRFILGRLQEHALTPSPPAPAVTWLRRVTLDLTGLPPTPEEVDEFLKQEGDGDSARAAVVERLLASPRYGERWAQHWLDVVRYADTHGFEVNTDRPHAWPYRDYVIDAFNRDTPYDQFIKEQIVGDAMGQDAATGFLVTASVLLPGQIGKDAPSIRLARQDAIDEIVNNIGQTFLGLSVGCARCHDHKFDAISAKDYYAMQSFVAGVEYADREIRSPQTDALKESAAGLREQLDRKSALEKRIEIAEAEKLAFAGKFREPDDIHLLRRGDPEQPTERVAPAVLSALGDVTLPLETAEQDRRRVLADWIADPHHPLTARVMVNRLWQWHFGVGLVETANDFGRNGTPPSHPELLDWLAIQFIESGWSVKNMHRMIVLSATYGQAAIVRVDASALDADVRLLWRYPSRRLEGEAIRDSMLAVNGQLNLKMGGRGYLLFEQRGGLSGFTPIESFTGEGLRRMIYAHKVRRETDATFGAFDCPDGGQSTARRSESTTPIQALNLFNSRFTIEQAENFAAELKQLGGDDPADQIRQAYRRGLNRLPEPDELADALPVVRDHGLKTFCRALFNSNEFLFLP